MVITPNFKYQSKNVSHKNSLRPAHSDNGMIWFLRATGVELLNGVNKWRLYLEQKRSLYWAKLYNWPSDGLRSHFAQFKFGLAESHQLKRFGLTKETFRIKSVSKISLYMSLLYKKDYQMCSNRETERKCDFTEIQIFENLKTITVGQVLILKLKICKLQVTNFCEYLQS